MAHEYKTTITKIYETARVTRSKAVKYRTTAKGENHTGDGAMGQVLILFKDGCDVANVVACLHLTKQEIDEDLATGRYVNVPRLATERMHNRTISGMAGYIKKALAEGWIELVPTEV